MRNLSKNRLKVRGMTIKVNDLEEFGKLYEAHMEKKQEKDELAGIEGRRKIYLRKKLMHREARSMWEAKLKGEFDGEYICKGRLL